MSGETVLNKRYRLISQHGSGGMAVIYKAVDEALGRNVAVKILRPSLTVDPSFVVRFQNEARSIANLSHPNIVTVHDVGSEGQTHYIVMEFIEGQDLKKIIRTHGALNVNRALLYAIGICAGIGYAHRAGIVHADIKPQNILITKDDIVKITDFGIAQALTDTQPMQRQSVVWGSPHYFAPEQARGERPSAASDVYAIGIVIFEMLTGRLPFTGADQQQLAMAHIRERVPLATEFNPGVPEALAKVVFKVMSKEPKDRYRMADQLGNILTSFRDQGRAQTAYHQPPIEEESEPRSSEPRRAEPRLAPPPPSSPASAPQPPPTAPPVSAPGQQTVPRAPSMPPAPIQRPAAPPMAPSPEALPTQRYSVAPGAPTSGGYGRPAVPGNPGFPPQPGTPAGQDSRLYQPGYAPNMAQRGGDSRPFVPANPYAVTPQDDAPPTLDAVTIALAVFAFMAVACLIPLYIAVLQSRL
jgi:serine/threonine-protein kinase